jgi:hypothetical protein
VKAPPPANTPPVKPASPATNPPPNANQNKPGTCSVFGEADRERCRATCDSEYNRKTAPLDTELFNCARTRDIERSGLHEDQCHAQCDRDHNPKSFDEDGCHRRCDDRVKSCHRDCNNSACDGWCDTDVKNGCHASCSGGKNQIESDRMGCHRSCSGSGNAITDRYNGCKAGVDGKRNQAELEQLGCYRGCDGQFNASQDCLKKGRPTTQPHACTCEHRDPKRANEGTGQTYQRPVETCTGFKVCLAACGSDIAGDCN